MGRFGRSLGSRAGAAKPEPGAPGEAGPPIWARLSVWAGMALLLAAPLLAVPEWVSREPDPLVLWLALFCGVAGTVSLTYYFTRVGSL